MRMFENASALMSHPSASAGATRMTPGNTFSGAPMAIPRTFKKGGKVKRTGMAKVHKGETVIPARKKKSVKKKSTKRTKTTKVNLGNKGSFKVKKGALHKALGVPTSEKLGPARISAALKSKNPRIRRMAASAKGLTAMRH